MSKRNKVLLFALLLVLSGAINACNNMSGFTIFGKSLSNQEPTIPPTETATPTPSAAPTSSITPSITPSPTKTLTPTKTETPTITLTPSNTPTATISPTPTIDFPDVVVNVNSAHCRYGPGTAYLHAADLFDGDHGLVWNRNYAGTWLWVRFDKLHYACWVAASVTDIEGDVFSVSTYTPPLPKSTLYGPPEKIAAVRSGNQVVVTWQEVWMTEDDDRGYLIEARICQNGYLIDVAVHTEGTSYTFSDESNCDGESKGRLFAVEKHGYTDFVQIPWP